MAVKENPHSKSGIQQRKGRDDFRNRRRSDPVVTRLTAVCEVESHRHQLCVHREATTTYSLEHRLHILTAVDSFSALRGTVK